MEPEIARVPEAFKTYEDGKQRRYNLLFAVNGGAFAIAKLPFGQEPVDLGHLSLSALSFGMIAFTAIMIADIWTFGMKMHESYLPNAFERPGRCVLVSLGLLICIGWGLVAWPVAQPRATAGQRTDSVQQAADRQVR